MQALTGFDVVNFQPDCPDKVRQFGAVPVIGPLAASESADREINGVKVALRVSLDDGASLPLDEAVLQRGRVYSVWVVAGESGPQARLEEANVATMP